MALRRGRVAAALVTLAASIALLAVILQGESEDTLPTSLSALTRLEGSNRKFASCFHDLKGEGMTHVADVDHNCGDLFTSTSCSAQCRESAVAFADYMGCCWRPLMAGFTTVEPTAAHAWHSWAASLQNLCGVSVAGGCESKEYERQKNAAKKAVDMATEAANQAKQEQSDANDAREAAERARKQAREIQDEMNREKKMYDEMTEDFRQEKADAARAVIVERLVHNSVKRDVRAAWALHGKVRRDRIRALRAAQGTAVLQRNGRKLIKSAKGAAHAAVHLHHVAAHAKHAAWKLHRAARRDAHLAHVLSKGALSEKEEADDALKKEDAEADALHDMIDGAKGWQSKAGKLWDSLQEGEKEFGDDMDDAESAEEKEEAFRKYLKGKMHGADSRMDRFKHLLHGVAGYVHNAKGLGHAIKTLEAQGRLMLNEEYHQARLQSAEQKRLDHEALQLVRGHRGVVGLETRVEQLRNKFNTLARRVAYMRASGLIPPASSVAHLPPHYAHYVIPYPPHHPLSPIGGHNRHVYPTGFPAGTRYPTGEPTYRRGPIVPHNIAFKQQQEEQEQGAGPSQALSSQPTDEEQMQQPVEYVEEQ